MLLELTNITFSVGRGAEASTILNNLMLNVEEGKITALIGGNGAGKTTLFNIISGFQNGATGEIKYNGESIVGVAPHRIVQKGVGRLFQGSPLFPDLTLMENLILGIRDDRVEIPFISLINPRRVKQRENTKKEKVIELLKILFGSHNKYLSMLEVLGRDLSYAEQRLIQLARLFLGDYKLLLLDEPTAGVNLVYNETIKEIISMMVKTKNMTVFLIEHNMKFVRELADICAYLDSGVIKHVGATKEVLNDAEVKNSYLGVKR